MLLALGLLAIRSLEGGVALGNVFSKATVEKKESIDSHMCILHIIDRTCRLASLFSVGDRLHLRSIEEEDAE